MIESKRRMAGGGYEIQADILGNRKRRTPNVEGELILPHGLSESHIAGLKVKLNLFWSTEDLRAVIVKVVFPARDDNGGETVAHKIHGGAAHGKKVRIKN